MKSVQINPEGNFDPWDLDKIKELRDVEMASDSVGQKLLYKDETSRLWNLTLWPTQRMPFRRHCHPCSFICMTEGLAISRYASGKIDLLQFDKGDSKYVTPNETNHIWDLENVGEHIINLYILEFHHKLAIHT